MKEGKRISQLLAVIVTMIVILTVINIAVVCDGMGYDEYKYSASFQNEWVYSDTGEAVKDSAILIRRNQTVRISNIIPDNLPDNCCIGIFNTMFKVVVRIDDKPVYSFGEKQNLKFGQEPGNVWNIVSLNNVNEKSKIEIEVTNYSYHQYFGFRMIKIGNKNDIRHDIIESTKYKAAECIITGFIVVILFVYSVMLKKYNVFNYYRIIRGLTLLTLSCFTWFISDCNSIQFYTGYPTVVYAVSILSFYMIPVFLMLLYREIFKRAGKVINIYLSVYSVVLSIIVILYRFNIWHISMSMILIHICMTIGGVMLVAECIKEYVHTRKKTYIGPTVALVLLCVFGILNALQFYSTQSGDNSFLFRMGYIIFILILIFTTIHDSIMRFSGIWSFNKYRQLAYIEPVTQGNSRIRFEDKLKKIYERNDVDYWLVYMNLINFKAVNETIGWEEGNHLLSEIYAANLSVLKQNEMQSSIGNAEYAFLVKKGSDIFKINSFCTELRKNTDKCINNLHNNLSVGIELSACRVNNPDEGFDRLLDHAKMACKCKQAQYLEESGCWIYNEECSKELIKEKEMENRLAEALERHEFKLYLQPKVNPRTSKVNGAEALVRWVTDDNSIISPGEFIPLFEKNGMISKIDLYMFKEVCLQINRWIEAGIKPLTVSVNVSRVGIENKNLFTEYQKIIDEVKAPMEYIEFEFTESAAYNNIENMQELIDNIHALHAKCSMDDFGSSYANFGAIQQLDFDTIKLDKCMFDNDFQDKLRSRKFINGIISMLRGLNIKVVCEGIEKEQQVEALKKMDCDSIQGFYYSKPLPVNEFNAFWEKHC